MSEEIKLTKADRIPIKHLPGFIREVCIPAALLFKGTPLSALTDSFAELADYIEAEPDSPDALGLARSFGMDDLNNLNNAQAYAMWVAGGGLDK